MIDLATTQRTRFRVDEVAEIVGRTRRTIYNWIAAGRIEVIQPVPGGGYWITIDVVRALMAPKICNDFTKTAGRQTITH